MRMLPQKTPAWVILALLLVFTVLALPVGCARYARTGELPPAVPNGYRLPWGWSSEARTVRVAVDGQVLDKAITVYVSPPPHSIPFVYVPAGSFIMGSPPDEPGRTELETPHRVRFLEPFLMSAYEVTNAQYAALLPTETGNVTAQTRPKAPVTRATWAQAVRFSRELSGELGAELDCRLPTEAEWEYACRAGSTTAFSWGSEPRTEWFNSEASGSDSAADAGSYPANAWGLFDMHGNAIEWCRDRYRAKPYGHRTRIDPLGPLTGSMRVQRGGSYNRPPEECRSAARHGGHPHEDLGGFRLVVHIPRRRHDPEAERDTIRGPFPEIFGDD